MIKLYQAMDRMRNRFGEGMVQRAIGNGNRRRNFNPFNGR